MALTALPTRYNVPLTYGDEVKQFRTLLELGSTMSSTGNVSFTSATSGTVYNTATGTGVPAQDTYIVNKGQQGLYYWLNLDTILGTYNLTKAWCDIIIANFAKLSATTDSASGADNVGATAISGGTATTVQGILEELNSLKPNKAIWNGSSLDMVAVGANLKIKMGAGTASTAGVANTFPVAFPNACTFVFANCNGGSTNAPITCSVTNKTQFDAWSTSTVNISYIAFGY